jgi:hypothetical protein
VRSAALFDLVDRALPNTSGAAQLVVRDLMQLDGALARLAGALQMDIRDHDTTTDLPAGSRARRAGRDCVSPC